MARLKKHNKSTVIINIAITIAVLVIISATAFFQLRLAGERLLRDFFAPFLMVPNKAKDYLSDKTLLLRDKTSLAVELERLKRENQILAARIAASADLKIENESLRNTLNLEQAPNWNYIYARPLLRNPINWQERFLINKGENSGIIAGALAITCVVIDGKTVPVVIGRIDNVSRHTASVNTLTNRATNLAVSLPKLGVAGFTAGSSNLGSKQQINITYLPREKVYPPNTAVFTSGFNRAIPPGILVGYLDGTVPLPGNRLYYSGKLNPVANLAAVNFIIIMVRDK
ncbi:MAG: rod shape-determining protein MreC [Victivallaceae bacterium]|nr:rod shape-determining protein MreC [Victivallaceae bacterium]